MAGFRSFSAISVAALLGAAGCSRQPCVDGGSAGPQVRLDLALGTCNAAPVADAGAGGRIAKRADVELDGTRSSDANGDELSYAWTLDTVPPGSAATIVDPTAAKTSFEADVAGVYVVSLVVSDGELSSAPYELSFTARNAEPTASAGADASAPLGASVRLDGSASADPDGDPLRYAWAAVTLPTGSRAQLDDASRADPSFTADERGVYSFSLTVTDGELTSAPDTVDIGVGISASRPVASAGGDRTERIGMVVTLDGSASRDGDGDAITYAWRFTRQPAASRATLQDPQSASPSFTLDAVGEYAIQLAVNDGYWASEPDVVVITSEADPLGRAAFDPDRVWVFATLNPFTRDLFVLCDSEYLDEPTAGFPFMNDPIRSPNIRPTDGALFYRDYLSATRGLTRQFVPEPMPFNGGYEYPTMTDANDPPFTSTHCPAATTPQLEFFHPSTAAAYFVCIDNRGYAASELLQEDGTAVARCGNMPGAAFPFAIGHDGSLLCTDSITDSSGASHPLSNPPENPGDEYGFRARAIGGGFWSVRKNATSYERWVTLPDGTQQRDHDYGVIPTGYTDFPGYGGVLDADGNLFQWSLRGPTGAIIKYVGQALGVVLMEENTRRVCQLMPQVFSMFTGP